VPGARAELHGVEIRINSKGLREREIAYERSAGTYRVLFLGDSLTLGWGVPFERTFPKLLGPALSAATGRPVEVINAGVGNYNTVQEWAYFETEGIKYDPDHVMLLYFINDAEPTPAYHAAALQESSMLLVFSWSRLTRLMTRLGLRQDFLAYYAGLYADSSAGWRASKEALRHLDAAARADGRRFTVFVCPELRVFKGSYPFLAQHREILAYLTAEGIEHMDLLPLFRERPESESEFWVSKGDSHPNALGHRVIADAVATFVGGDRP